MKNNCTEILLEGGLLEGVMISSNPLRMEDNVLVDEMIPMDKISFYCELSKKLGWGEIAMGIAIPAMDKIINSYLGCIMEVYGMTVKDIESMTVAWQKDILSTDNDALFSYLYIDGFDDMFDYIGITAITSLRSEIEQEMKNGVFYQEAIKKWLK
jgi:hypothetical protein